MRKIWSVIKREYLQIVKTKGFIIGTILGPVLMAALVLVPLIAQLASVGEQKTIGVIDVSGGIFPELGKKLDYKMKDGRKRYVLDEYAPTGDINALRTNLSQKVLAKELSAYLFIPKNILEAGDTEYVSLHVSDFEEIRRINEALNSVVIEKRLRKEGLDPEKIAGFIRRIGMKTIKVTAAGEEEDTGGTFAVSYLLVLILYMTLFFYGAIIMRGVIEEKNSRVVEVILSSMRPFELMVGKILGIGAVGFTQYAIWALFGLSLTRYGRGWLLSAFPAASAFKMPSIPAYIFIYFILFFILGYFLYGTLYAAVGAMVNSEKEAQQLLMPLTMLLIVPMLLMMLVMRSPNSPISVILSLIPFFAPILMLLRICILLPSFAQVAGSIGLLVLTIVMMIWITARVYRVGILMYGKRPNLTEIVKWIRYK
jgi:ABC-2 type transport system permease protein